MTLSLHNFQFDRNESLRGLLLPFILFTGAVVIQIKMAWHTGFFGFGSPELPAAGFQESLTVIFSREAQHSFLVRWLETLTLQGFLGPRLWQAMTLFVHYTNVILAYFVGRKVFQGTVGVSLATAALVGMNPLGMDALVWGCCFQVILTLTWIFAGLLIYRYHDKTEYSWALGLRAVGLVFLQVAAFMTWDFGLIFFPIVAIIALSSPNDAPKKARKRSGILLLTTVGIVWLVGSAWILGSSAIMDEPLLPWVDIVKNLMAAPIEGLFPLLGPDQFWSPSGFILAVIVYGLLGALVVLCPSNWSLLAAAAISSLPWVLFGKPDGADFYLSLPFLYLCVASLKEMKEAGVFCLFVTLFFQFIWMYERVQLVEKGAQAASALEKRALKIMKDDPKAYFVDYPEVYGQSRFLVPAKMKKKEWIRTIKTSGATSRLAATHADLGHTLFDVKADPSDETAFIIEPLR